MDANTPEHDPPNARFDAIGAVAASNAQRLDRIEREFAQLTETVAEHRVILDELLELAARRFADQVETWLDEGGE